MNQSAKNVLPPHVVEEFEERAALFEYMGNMKRADAERLAWLHCIKVFGLTEQTRQRVAKQMELI